MSTGALLEAVPAAGVAWACLVVLEACLSGLACLEALDRPNLHEGLSIWNKGPKRPKSSKSSESSESPKRFQEVPRGLRSSDCAEAPYRNIDIDSAQAVSIYIS